MELRREIYIVQAMERIDFYSEFFWRAQIIPTIGVYFGPYIWQTYQWLIGEYSSDKWFYISKIWYSSFLGANLIQDCLLQIVFLMFSTPFEMDTAAKWIFVTMLKIANAFVVMTVFHWTSTMFIEFMMYPRAVIRDIQSIFGQMDRLSRSRNPKHSEVMVDHCKEIIDLMCRINR